MKDLKYKPLVNRLTAISDFLEATIDFFKHFFNEFNVGNNVFSLSEQ